MKISKKQQIFEDLARRIKAEEWPCGSRLPKMTELCAHYGVSIITLIGAMKLLKEAGFVEQRRGSGTFVLWNREQIFFPRLNSSRRTVEITHSLLNADPLNLFIMNQLAECFMRVYSDVNIRFVNLPLNKNGEDPYMQRIMKNDLPSCGEFYWHAVYAKLDALVPLEELPGYQTLKSSLMEQCVYPTSDSSGNQHIHALTIYLDLPNFGLINSQWSKSLNVNLPHCGITFASIAKMLRSGKKRKNSGFFSLGLPLPKEWHNVKQYMEFLSQGFPKEGYDPNDPASILRILNSDCAGQALESLEELIHAADPRICLGKINEYYALGKVGILPFAGSWSLILIGNMNNNMDYNVFPMPPVCGTKFYRPFYAGFSVGIFRDGISSARQQEAAWDWLKFLFCKRTQELHTQSMHIPVRKDAISYTANLLDPGIWKIAKESLSVSLPQPDFVGIRRVYAQMSDPLRRFLKQEINSKKCLALLRSLVSL